jgi:chromosome segregation ATPase
MANVKASELELDKLVEGNEKLVSTDGDGTTRNIKTQDLADFAVKQAEKSIKPGIEANTTAIESNSAQIETLKSKDNEIESKVSDLQSKDATIEANIKDLQDKIADTSKTDAVAAELEALKKQHEEDVESLQKAHDNPWEDWR